MKIFDSDLNLVNLQDASVKGKLCDTFVFTRFNLKLWKTNKFGVDTRTHEWTAERFGMFEKYCFPSMLHQTDKNFIWMCMFADDTEECFIERIRGGIKQIPQFIPVFLSEQETKNLSEAIDCFIRKFKSPSDTLITSRIDNDDAVNISYVEMMHKLSQNQQGDDCIYSMERGLQYYVKKNLSFAIKYPDNHYLFLKCNKYAENNIHHVLTFNHSKIKEFKYPFKLISGLDYMWVEVIHENNVANDVKMTLCQKPIVDRKLMQKKFYWNVELSNCGVSSYFTFILPRIAHLVFLKIRKRILNKTHY